MYTATLGSTLKVKTLFTDEFDNPIMSNEDKPPVVRFYDDKKDLIHKTYPVPGIIPGEWVANVPVPELKMDNDTEFNLIWTFVDVENTKYKLRDIVQIKTQPETRERTIVAVYKQDKQFIFNLPFAVKASDTIFFSLYEGNIPLIANLDINDESVKKKNMNGKTQIRIPMTVPGPALQPFILLANHIHEDDSDTYTFKIWVVTPQILKASMNLEEFLNKARLENIIPELDYTQNDLLHYLERGLNLFNSFPPALTFFNGTNMQGPLYDCWLISSCYYALAAQLQAEGALSFDFSGQSVNLNIDRTPQLESALSRIEGSFDSIVKPYKRLLSKTGYLSGDGSAAGKHLSSSRSFGTLGLTNAPTTRLPFVSPFFRGKRWW